MLTFVRRFSSSASLGKHISIGRHNIEVVRNDVKERECDAFWNTHRSTRSDLKRSDLKRFRDAWGADFHHTHTFIKGTDRLVASNAHTVFRPLDANNVSGDVVFQSFFWVTPDAKGSKLRRIATQQCHDVGFGVRNSMACTSEKHFKTMSGSKNAVLKYYVSHYDIDDLCIPEKLNTAGITVKNARDVADGDILNYDAKVFKYHRSEYVLSQLRDDVGRVAYNEAGEVVGFGGVSVYPSGECSISAMYADDKKVARAILKSILEEMTLDGDKYWRLQVRSNDHFADSYGWMRPFVKTMTHRHEICSLMCDHKQLGMDFSKVFVNFHPTHCPM